jgi:hypothetical protein
MSPTTVPLLRGLVDDAAVFPPGSAPLEVAVARHAGHRSAPYAACVGPLLLPPSAVGRLGPVVEAHWPDEEPLRVVVVARPGADLEELVAAVAAPGVGERVEVVGAELGWAPGWADVDLRGLPVAVEVPRGAAQAEALDDVAVAAGRGRPVVAKFRTGPTPTWPWPDERELAAFLVGVARRGVPFRLTGGLHHAVRGAYSPGQSAAWGATNLPIGSEGAVSAETKLPIGSTGAVSAETKLPIGSKRAVPAETKLPIGSKGAVSAETKLPIGSEGAVSTVTKLPIGSDGARGLAVEENHGVLNVLLGTAAAVGGAAPEDVAAVLARRDAEALAAEARALDDRAVARVRGAFTAYGCCEVTDPVGELAALGLDVGS